MNNNSKQVEREEQESSTNNEKSVETTRRDSIDMDPATGFQTRTTVNKANGDGVDADDHDGTSSSNLSSSGRNNNLNRNNHYGNNHQNQRGYQTSTVRRNVMGFGGPASGGSRPTTTTTSDRTSVDGGDRRAGTLAYIEHIHLILKIMI